MISLFAKQHVLINNCLLKKMWLVSFSCLMHNKELFFESNCCKILLEGSKC